MKRGTQGWLPALALLASVGCATGERREPVDFERMRRQQRYDVYQPSPVFRDGKVMQTPPRGTVPREAATGGVELRSGVVAGVEAREPPMPVTPAVLEQGRGRFEIYCAVCHGAGGFGGSIVASNMDSPRPPSLRTPAIRARPAGYFFSIITNGMGRMPSYAWALSVEQRWAVVAYLRTLQTPHVAQPFEVDDSLAAAALASAREHAGKRRRP